MRTMLNCDAIQMKPVDVDWREAMGDDLEGFQWWETAECCGRERVMQSGCCPKCGDHCDSAEGPMMNYFYPVEIRDCAAAAKSLGSGCLCVVEMKDGKTGLALTGGGMDLSWEICEAFFKLGFYPPAHFARLPKMSGRGESKADRRIIRACRASLSIAAKWARNELARFKEDWPVKKPAAK